MKKSFQMLEAKSINPRSQSQQAGSYSYIVPFYTSAFASGIYFVRLRAKSYTNIQKLTLIR
jgi:hypothetical protein